MLTAHSHLLNRGTLSPSKYKSDFKVASQTTSRLVNNLNIRNTTFKSFFSEVLVFSGGHTRDADKLFSKHKNEVECAVRHSRDLNADHVVNFLAYGDHSLTRGEEDGDISSDHAVNTDIGVVAHLCAQS